MEDDKYVELKKTLSEHFWELFYIAEKISSNTKSSLKHLEKDIRDIEKIEDAALELITFLKSIKGNIFYILDNIENKIKQINTCQNAVNFGRLTKKIRECRSNNIVKVKGQYVYTTRIDKSTNTDLDNKISGNSSIASENCIKKEQLNHEETEKKWFLTSPSKRKNTFALINNTSSSSQDLDEYWIDSLHKILKPSKDIYY